MEILDHTDNLTAAAAVSETLVDRFFGSFPANLPDSGFIKDKGLSGICSYVSRKIPAGRQLHFERRDIIMVHPQQCDTEGDGLAGLSAQNTRSG